MGAWVTGQANSGYGFITLNNGYKQEGIVMNSPVTVTANFSNNVLTVSTSTTPKVAPGSSFTAQYGGMSAPGTYHVSLGGSIVVCSNTTAVTVEK